MLSKQTFSQLSVFFMMLVLTFLTLPVLHAADPLLEILDQELKREMKELNKQEHSPYYMSYTVVDTTSFQASASFGALTDSDKSHHRNFAVMVRIGDHTLDSTHEIRGDFMSSYLRRQRSFVPLPLDLNADALSATIWKETNKRYNQAVDIYSKVKANVAVKIEEEDNSADFSIVSQPEVFEEASLEFDSLLPDPRMLEEKVKKFSQPFLENVNIYNARAEVVFYTGRQYIVSSEGTKIVQNKSIIRLFITSVIKSDDGMELPLYKSYSAFTPQELPSDEKILADVAEMVQMLETLKNAPVVEPYSGPVLLSGRAAGVFFHEIFGHRVEGHRLKEEDDSQTFKKKINQKVLPDHMSVHFDPLLKKYEDIELMGYYRYDDEGVKAQKVNIIEAGILKNFLMSRSPLEDFTASNGHGRAALGYAPVARQSNMIITSTSLLPMDQLRAQLIAELKKQEKPFGLRFDDIVGGFTFTGRFIPNAFNVIPTVVYKVYPDGRPDELVRGVDLVGTPLVMFSNITQAGDEYDVFNGICGAESGGVPVSAVCPALLVTKVEVQKKFKSQERPPILPRPDSDSISTND
ncbi:TldD/PmbA family protein [candidate division CSSED10-310 bacterium]|uniref:TldD/PmbA family protein n=1 Tax=candidate division CSSED10-310 bacterium TaxID=2855610 RepID=A0ABV6Z3Z4_UNCC1